MCLNCMNCMSNCGIKLVCHTHSSFSTITLLFLRSPSFLLKWLSVAAFLGSSVTSRKKDVWSAQDIWKEILFSFMICLYNCRIALSYLSYLVSWSMSHQPMGNWSQVTNMEQGSQWHWCKRWRNWKEMYLWLMHKDVIDTKRAQNGQLDVNSVN